MAGIKYYYYINSKNEIKHDTSKVRIKNSGYHPFSSHAAASNALVNGFKKSLQSAITSHKRNMKTFSKNISVLETRLVRNKEQSVVSPLRDTEELTKKLNALTKVYRESIDKLLK